MKICPVVDYLLSLNTDQYGNLGRHLTETT